MDQLLATETVFMENNTAFSNATQLHANITQVLMMGSYTREECLLAHQLNNDIYFLGSLFFSSVVSLIASPSLIYFIYSKLLTAKFHTNLKILLILYFGSLSLFSLGVSFGFGYRFVITFFVQNDCELLIDPIFFKYYHLGLLGLMTFSMLLPIGFAIERFIALFNAKIYEHSFKHLGSIISTILFAFEDLLLWLIYKDETFAGPHYALVLVPTTSATLFNLFFYFFIGVQLFSLVCTVIILIQNRRMAQKKENQTVSMRFVMIEVYEATRLMVVVGFLHVFFVGCYVVGGLTVRLLGPSYFDSVANYLIARAIYCSVPIYNLVIPLVGFKVMNDLEKKRKKEVNETIQLKSIGEEGMKNYQDLLKQIWD
ncbi:hypothetical protein CAEBREN_07398 [Caenorhabditis brenneri]|uniref:Uncharacterized protein n=1 Tax=Caenorhabditis brenneri TaxID=135651 RepID=G0N4G8_CAEBE|nr:hypothetical protein CAEBREN_07398 [Caenorhabditis brenneri]